MENHDNMMLLHVCCGPCATGVVPALIDDKTRFETFFFNPNVQPESEYRKRLSAFNSYAVQTGLRVHEDEYNPDAWFEAIGNSGGVYPLIKGDTSYEANRSSRISRCRRCYAHRFERLAKFASEHGFCSISSTLSISPYQYIDFIDLHLEEAAQKFQLKSAFCDYSSKYRASMQASRDLGMYRQNYCGCIYSKEEAELERVAREQAKADNRS